MAEEKTKTALLREELMYEPKGVKALSAEEIADADAFCEGYKQFLNASPVEREAVAYTVAAAEAAGFVPFDPEGSYQAGDKIYLVKCKFFHIWYLLFIACDLLVQVVLTHSEEMCYVGKCAE